MSAEDFAKARAAVKSREIHLVTKIFAGASVVFFWLWAAATPLAMILSIFMAGVSMRQNSSENISTDPQSGLPTHTVRNVPLPVPTNVKKEVADDSRSYIVRVFNVAKYAGIVFTAISAWGVFKFRGDTMRRKNLVWSALFLASIAMAIVAAAGPSTVGKVLLASLSLFWSPDIFASVAIWLAIFGQIWLRLKPVKDVFQDIIEV